MIYGFDIDGVLADFNADMIERTIAVTGKDLFPPRPFDIPVWDYPQHFGYSEREVQKVWDSITKDPTFWRALKPYPGARETIGLIRELARVHDVYFITSRPGIRAKAQTEDWLTWGGDRHIPWAPTVLLSGAKGLAAATLKLDAYVDDKFENCEMVVQDSPGTRVYLVDRPWNRGREYPTVLRVNSARDMLTMEEEELNGA